MCILILSIKPNYLLYYKHHIYIYFFPKIHMPDFEEQHETFVEVFFTSFLSWIPYLEKNSPLFLVRVPEKCSVVGI